MEWGRGKKILRWLCSCFLIFSNSVNSLPDPSPPPYRYLYPNFPYACPIDENLLLLATLNQAVFPNYQIDIWRLGSFLNFDLSPKTMQKTTAGEEEDYLALSNAGFNLDAVLNSWARGHLGLAYYQTNKGQGDFLQHTGLLLDDAYILLGDLPHYPYFLQLGILYLPFGIYDRYAIIPSLTQVLAESRAASLQLGVINWQRLSFTAYISQAATTDSRVKIQGDLNFGAALLFNPRFNEISGLNLGLQYIDNMLNTNAFLSAANFTFNNYYAPLPIYPRGQKIPGLASQISAYYQNAYIFANYVSALKPSNLIYHHYLHAELQLTDPSLLGAQPSSFELGFNFTTHQLGNFPLTFFGSWQHSYDAAGLILFNSHPIHALPRCRYWLGAGLTIYPGISFDLQVSHDILYPHCAGDSGREGDAITFRTAFRI